jgi:hypothetical protein
LATLGLKSENYPNNYQIDASSVGARLDWRRFLRLGGVLQNSGVRAAAII